MVLRWPHPHQVVLTVVRVSPFIAGTVTWPKSLMDPGTEDIAAVSSKITIMTNRYERVQPSGGFAYDKLTPVTPGRIFEVDVGTDTCVAKYRVDNPPMTMDPEGHCRPRRGL